MAWDDRYRQLEVGEIIREGDEVEACRDGWRDQPKWEPVKHRVGQPAPDPACPSHSRFRRRIAAAEKEHVVDGTECWCRPYRDPEEPSVIVHNSVDRREDYERSRH